VDLSDKNKGANCPFIGPRVNTYMKCNEIFQKPKTADELRVQTMKSKVKQDQAMLKAEKARQKIRSGQQDLGKVIKNSI
jgi:hypothetical protein